MVDFSSITNIVIPEGSVIQITVAGKVLWSKKTDDSSSEGDGSATGDGTPSEGSGSPSPTGSGSPSGT